MIKLKYKTRENTSPQGKPRVYFCCHPEDFSKYFETVANEVLEKQNCTIWYVDEDTSRDDEFFGDLKQMQLFVMPVTTNLLCSPNVALYSEFKFAVENHIPVLPLMQENGLEKLFNEKCGDLQFLDKHNVDSTAIGYDEKLQKYLETVLIGDELAEKIRAAFDAYVFLSYRKKDRRYAQELMRLIHKNEFCRDIAIWYDEFLTPGENFNDSIKKALQKSGLFVLTVTPNLINEQNYIMTTEYPMARQEGKPVLPAELVPTDRGILSEKYADIPDPTNAYNDVELSEALLDSIKRMNIKENDISPEHNFFIGLAYLGGVDVEVDYERAIDLIGKAADSGLLEAIKKLVTIYHKGIGVKKDVLTAIKWQLKALSSLSLKNEENYADVILLGELYQEVGNYKEAKKLYALLAGLGATSLQGLYYVAVALYKAGNIEVETSMENSKGLVVSEMEPGTYENALMLYNESLERFEKIAASGTSVLDDINVVYLHFAKLYCRLGEFAKARRFMAQIFSSPNWENDMIAKSNYSLLIDCYFVFGDVYKGMVLPYETMQQYSLTLKLVEKLSNRLSDTDVLKYKGLYHQKIAVLYMFLGNDDKAWLNLTIAEQNRLELAQKENLSSSWHDVAETYDEMSKFCERKGEQQKAIDYAVEAQYAARKSGLDTDSPQQLEQTAVMFGRMVELAENSNYTQEPVRLTKDETLKVDNSKRNIETLTSEAQNTKKESDWLRVVREYKYLAQIYVDAGAYEMAIKHYQQAVEILEYCYEHFKSLSTWGLLARFYIRIGDVYSYMNRWNTCMDYKVKAFPVLETLQNWQKEGEALLTSANSAEEISKALSKLQDAANAGNLPAIRCLVNVYSEGEKVPKNIICATNWQIDCVQRYAEIYLFNPSAENAEHYAAAAKRLGEFYEQRNNSTKAIYAYQLSLDILMSICENDITEDISKDILYLQQKITNLSDAG